MFENAFLDDGEKSDNFVYYKLLLRPGNKLAVVCLQEFDEGDYNQHEFIKADCGKCAAFFSEGKAVAYAQSRFGLWALV